VPDKAVAVGHGHGVFPWILRIVAGAAILAFSTPILKLPLG